MPKQRQTCTECSMRRQKCDRNVPCSRCVKRGEPDKCTREWPEEGYDPKKHRIYPRPEQDQDDSPSISSDRNDATVTNAEPKSRTAIDSPAAHHTPRPRTVQTDPDKDVSVLDFLTWGRGNLADYQVKSFDLLKEPFKNNDRLNCPEQEFSNGFGNSNAQQLSFLQLLLPRREQMILLVDFHLSHVLWYHACFHGESFYNELQAHYQRPNGLQIREIDLRWMALLFAIMAGSMVCANESRSTMWGFPKAERYKLTKQWYKASLTCLNLSDYMWRHHLWSVEAICVLTMSGHILGFSNTQSTLHGAALKIAQGLGLQRLGPEADESILNDRDLTPAKREKIIRREIGRRVWAQVCNQDWFSIPFSEMYSIQKSHFSTLRPQHLDDHTLLPIPAHEPSFTSFSRCINDIASIMPQAHDALTSATTLYTKYEQVLHHDAKMKALERDGVPSFLSLNEQPRSDWPQWVSWARRSLKLCFAHKTIMIHRSFLGKAFTDPTFDHTRRTCMEASKSILVGAADALEKLDGPMLWIDQAFMVAAGITLSLDIFHRQNSDPKYEEHRKHVEAAITMLSKFEYSMIAVRGVRLLTSLLAEQARLSAEKSMENYKKRTREDENGLTPDRSTTPRFVQAGPDASFTSTLKRPKFDVPKFLENFVGVDSGLPTAQKPSSAGPAFANNIDTMPSMINGNGDLVLGNGQLGNVLMQQQSPERLPILPNAGTTTPSILQNGFDALGASVDYGPDAFEQIFPPHAGISNSFLFEDLLNFEV